MGLFKKIANSLQKKPEEKALDGLVEFHRKRGDIQSAFYFANKATVDFWDGEFWARWNRANTFKDGASKMQALRLAESCLNEFREWCTQYKGGLSYYDEMWTNYREMVDTEIERTDYLFNRLPAEILQKAQPGIAQIDLLRSFDPSKKFVVQDEIERLVAAGKLHKEKQGGKWWLSVK